MKHDTVAALLRQDGRVLLCQRSFDREWHPGVWELPGGHVEDDTPRNALLRELREELGIVADLSEECSLMVENSDARVSIWEVESWTGILGNRDMAEHSAVEWISPAAAPSLKLGPLASHLLRKQTVE